MDRRLDTLEQEAVEQMLEQLREENARLEGEHRALVAGTREGGQSSEERSLRQQRGRLEARMVILEDHNRQLEAQLDRLRQLVTSGETGEGRVIDATGGEELGSVVVVASTLHHPSMEPREEPRPHPPPRGGGLEVPLAREGGSGHSSARDSHTSGDTARLSMTSGSLDLSIHNTEVQDD